MTPELKTLILIHKNYGSVIDLVVRARGGRDSDGTWLWLEAASDGEIADWILFQSRPGREGNEYRHNVTSQAWREYFASLSEVEQMLHLSDGDDDDWVDPQSWLSTGKCDYPVEKIIPDHLRWKDMGAAPAVL